jgi:Protein of unknown function (DUF2490)
MKYFSSISLFLACSFLYSQTEKNVDQQSLLWTRYYNLLNLNDKWSVHTEIDNRVFLNPLEQNLYLIRIHGHYKIYNNIDLGAGFAYFSVASQYPEVSFEFNIPEYRGQQDITWKKVYGYFTLNQRFQVEERFFHNANNVGLLPGTTFFWRFRYRIQGEFNFWKKENKFLKVIVYDELMMNGGENVVKNTFDQNRIYAALDYGINKNITLELGYLNSFQQRTSGVDYFNRDIIRFTFYHKVNLEKKK